MKFNVEIRNFCESLGLDLVGFSECREFSELNSYFEQRKNNNLINEFEEKDTLLKINPFQIMKDGKTIISIAFPYKFPIDTDNDAIKDKSIYFSRYTLGQDYHKVVKKYLEKIAFFINERFGGKTEILVDSNALPERYIAYLGGIGFIGKNKMFITEKYGSYVFLGEIITDLKMEWDNPLKNKCEECFLCLNACPSKALISEDFNKCLSYITQKKQIENKWFSKLDKRIFGCDTCQEICPYNKNVTFSNLIEFKPLEFMEKLDKDDLLNLTESSFKEKYKKSSCGWRGKNIIKRNVLINLYKQGYINKENYKSDSPYLMDYYNRLLKETNL
ncbi:tRNA epoxyqueuosine(34) reductase QueG [Clostridium grantii]|uniref:Epoxyqueuosine reductase n=1 Tax=Clostridium grantii DSM 8605 TaxID=1121316 RepID=A0A1M5RRV0_9CLOT|nr:tRNA epoxyqueuosine(34) reductase QueG [Clostridium grantii]SHH29015.1 epoxyqueuosine reductase [Clostridium grantii DSM 8605]